MTNEIDKGTKIRQFMTYGAIIGTITIVYSLILYSTGINEFIVSEKESFISNLRVIIVGLGIFYSVRHFSEKILQSKISFFKFIFYGTTVGFFFSIIDASYFVIFTKYIAPSTIDLLYQGAETQYLAFGISNSDVDTALTLMKKPFSLFLIYLFSNTALTAVYSILFAILYSFMNLILPKKQ